MKTRENVRAAMVSGQFYSADPVILRKKVRRHLGAARSRPDSSVRMLIVPHAGHDYSGPVAAEAYKTVKGLKFENVVVIAFLHRVFAQGVLVDDVSGYETPLGRIPVDREFAAQIRKCHPALQEAVPVRFNEHSLEVQLPFLQEVIPELRIVPVYMGMQDLGNATALANALAQTTQGRNVLVVATTDLSHFHSYEDACRMDKALLDLFEQGDVESIFKACAREEAEACGLGPVISSILLAKQMKWSGPDLLCYANSGDVTGERSSVVGYAAMVYREGPC